MQISLKKDIIKYTTCIFIIICIDQFTKLYTHFKVGMGPEHAIKLLGNWLKIHHILNPGMAWGIEINFIYGKLILTVVRFIAIGMITKLLHQHIIRKAHRGLVWSLSLILGGAIGNTIDGVFYGVLLKNAPAGSITPWFHGQVIDMIYLDIWEGPISKTIPLIGGKYLSLWPIFNVADMAISIGIGLFLIFGNKTH